MNGFPTIKYYTFGNFVVEFDRPRTVEGFAAFMSQPPRPVPPEKADGKNTEDTRDEL